MSVAPRGPHTLKGALVSINDQAGTTLIVPFQYNPEGLRRTLQPAMVGGEEGDRSQAVRFKSAPIEQITIDVDLDAADLLEQADPVTTSYGLGPQLAGLELLVYPSSTEIGTRDALLASGTIEVAPLTAPRTLFVWGPRRVLPVRLESYTIAEEQFDTNLNPIRARV